MTEEPIKEDPVEKFQKLMTSFNPLSKRSEKEIKEVLSEGGAEAKEAKTEDGKSALSSLPQKSAKKNDALGALPKKARPSKSRSQAGSAACFRPRFKTHLETCSCSGEHITPLGSTFMDDCKHNLSYHQHCAGGHPYCSCHQRLSPQIGHGEDHERRRGRDGLASRSVFQF
ncbi:MAG: hypothetical protein IPJ47_08935 [Anaerolineales bacterium]|nr:hypothetical protein [Anaerolineales bacterium]